MSRCTFHTERGRTHLVLSGLVGLLALTLAVTGCDSNGGPPTGTLSVNVSTSGDSPDTDGYSVAVDDSVSKDVDPGGSITFTEIKEGTHAVALSGLAANCSVDGSNPQSVTILQGDSAPVSFSVTCRSTTGAIEVSAETTGDWPDTDGYFISIDGSDSTRTNPNGRATIHNLEQGSHEVQLTDRRFNCTVSGDNPRSVSVSAGKTTIASFEFSCPANLSGGIAFQSDRAGNPDIHAMGTDGSEVTQITIDAGGDIEPTVSPDGAHIALSSRRDGDFEIYKLTPDGFVTQLTDNGMSDSDPAWAPGGDRIAFETDRDGSYEIYTMKPDGTSLNRLTNDGAFDGAPAWKPDGSRIVFSTSRDGNTEIYTMKADGSDLKQVTSHSGGDSTPAWSPNGSRIAFASSRDGNFEIYTIQPDGTGLTRLTNDASRDINPAWSPDGSRIAFRSGRDGDEEIYTIKPDGSNLTRLTNNPTDDDAPAWGPSK